MLTPGPHVSFSTACVGSVKRSCSEWVPVDMFCRISMLLEFVFFNLVIGMCPMNAIACLAGGGGREGEGGVCLGGGGGCLFFKKSLKNMKILNLLLF